MKRLFALLAIFSSFSFTGCVSNQPVPEPAYYRLDPHSDSESPPLEYSIAIGSIELPKYLDTPSIVLELEDAKFHRAGYHLWSEPLEYGIRRVLEERLAAQASPDSASRVAMIEIERFHGAIDGQVYLAGRYRLLSAKDDQHPRFESFSLQTTLETDGYAALAKALGRLLHELADQIASE